MWQPKSRHSPDDTAAIACEHSRVQTARIDKRRGAQSETRMNRPDIAALYAGLAIRDPVLATHLVTKSEITVAR
jgi:hypothetical protein